MRTSEDLIRSKNELGNGQHTSRKLQDSAKSLLQQVRNDVLKEVEVSLKHLKM